MGGQEEGTASHPGGPFRGLVRAQEAGSGRSRAEHTSLSKDVEMLSVPRVGGGEET